MADFQKTVQNLKKYEFSKANTSHLYDLSERVDRDFQLKEDSKAY
jgi:hypothetical protein